MQLNELLSRLGLLNTVFFKDKEGQYSNGLHFDIQNKLKLINPDAIYVYNNQPLILFFDLTDSLDSKREEDIHKKVWSFDNSPIAFMVKGGEVKVYNALNYVKEEKRLKEISLSNEELLDKFSFWNLQSSNIWDWFQQEYIETTRTNTVKKRVNDKLFQNIRDVRNALIDRDNDPIGSIPNYLILRLIFIRYLIDRNIEIGSEFISGEDVLSRRLSFSQLIQQPDKLSQLFSMLNDRFNGVLFKNSKAELTLSQAADLANVFKGEVPSENSLFYGSDFYFEVFDFSIIPVEVISGIYESLIDPEIRNLQSAVYTPPFLVEYILNDTVDVFLREKNTSECRIFEVAVGSGVFLVQSLRRMIEKEIELNGKKNEMLFSERIRNIAKYNLYGVDINREALKVACFSIYIALLDYQEPKNINEYEFPNLLDENLFEVNFFDTKHKFNKIIKNLNPQYILGNPPWKSNKDTCHTEWLNFNKRTVGRFEIAQSFLLRTKDFMSIDTRVALVVTSTIFYNVSKTTRAFKKEFLTTYCISKFLDLSPVRRLIFEEKDSPASVVYYNLSKNNDYKHNIIDHQSVKINYFLKHFKMLVVEKFDKKKISQRHFIENDWMFKVALYGNTLDFNLIRKLTSHKNELRTYIDNKKVFGGSGILRGTPKKHFTFLEGLPLNENSYIEQFYTPNSNNYITYDDTFLESGRVYSLFNSSKILLKEQAQFESEIVVSYNKGASVFKKGVFGICSLDKSLIRKFYSYLLSDLYTYYVFCIAGSWGTSTRPQIRWEEEYLSFPILNISDEIIGNKLEELATEFINYFEDFYVDFKLGAPIINKSLLFRINEIIYKVYGIEDYEKDLIDYALNVSRYQFQQSKQHLVTDFSCDEKNYRNKDHVLKNYVEVFFSEFKDIYINEFLQAEIYYLEHFIAVNFVFCTDSTKDRIVYNDKMEVAEVLKILANKLSISQVTNTSDPTKNLFIQKDIKGFEDNSFYIIKPNEYKCWHRAVAWYDVAEFKSEIGKAELEFIKTCEDE